MGRFSPLGPRAILCSRYDVKSGSFKGSYDGKSHVSTVFFAPEDLVTCDAGGSLWMNDIGRQDCCADNLKNLRFVHGRLPWSVPRYHEAKRRTIKVKMHKFQTETPPSDINSPRRFPPPWPVIEHAESFWVQDAERPDGRMVLFSD